MNIQNYPSPNSSSRHGVPISLLVIHATAGSLRSALAELTDPKPSNPSRRVSAHFVIGKDGSVYQLVALQSAAWHAGPSAWRGLDSTTIQRCSIGYELENANTGRDPYPAAQYAALLALVRAHISLYRVPAENLVRHSDIAMPRGRKSDPAGFPWAQFRADALSVMTSTLRSMIVRFDGTSVRPTPSTDKVPMTSLAAGAEVRALKVVGGATVSTGLGTSDRWALLENGGYVWLPLLEDE